MESEGDAESTEKAVEEEQQHQEEEVQSSSSVGDNNKPEFNLNLTINMEGEKNKKPSEPTKGKGLKKWRRIRRREFASPSGGSAVDLNRILKRDSKSALDGSVAAPSAAKFTHGDSDNNSEEQSSRSSTAASVPKFRSHRSGRTAAAAATPLGGRSNPGRYSQTGRRAEKPEPTKKHRGGIHKDASYSSVESDLRSSNQFFAEISNGNGRHVNYDQDNCSEAQASDQQSNEYLFRDNGPWEDEVSQSAAGNGTWEQGSCNQQSAGALDPFTESILALQAVHDALEKEIQNFGEIGMEPMGLTGDSSNEFILNPEFHSVVTEAQESNLSGHRPIEEEIKKSYSLPLEADSIKINHKVYTLENKLKETMSMLEAKESRIIELEGILNETEFPKTEKESSVQSPQKCREIEAELEDLFRHKIEAEVEYLTMRKTSQKLKLASEDQIALFEEQKTLINEQNKILHNFRYTENNIPQTEKHKLAASGESVETEAVMKTQRNLCKYCCCFTIQLMLLFPVFGPLLFSLWPGPAEFAPT